MKKSEKRVVDRRKFLKGAAVGGVATLVASTGTLRASKPSRPRFRRSLPCRQGKPILPAK